MKTWQDILSAAWHETATVDLFTNRHCPGSNGPLDWTDNEHAVLCAAGTISLWRNAAYRPVMDDRSIPRPCEPDPQPRCSTRSSAHLMAILQGQHRDLLPEWLSALGRANQRVAEEALPALLEFGRSHPDLRLLILPVLGHRGHWLAARNPAWHYAIGENEDVVWQTGSQGERLFLLQRLRSATPDRARDVLRSTWSEEPARQRAAYLQAFTAGLSLSDESFLEEALRDRSKEVRRLAVDLLARIPESRWTGRMLERASRVLILNSTGVIKREYRDGHAVCGR